MSTLAKKQKYKIDFDDEAFVQKKVGSGSKFRGVVRKHMLLAKKAQAKEDWKTAVKHLNDAWMAEQDNLDVICVLAYSLTKLGVRHKAIKVIEHALATNKPNALLCDVMGHLAMEMAFDDLAVKIWRVVLQMEPGNMAAWVNLISCLTKANNLDEAIETSQNVIPLYPENAELWNVLASAVHQRDGEKAALSFYEEALRHSPTNYKILNNISRCTDDPDVRLDALQKAKKYGSGPEIDLGLAFEYISRGKLKKGLKLYEARYDRRRRAGQSMMYTNSVTRWQGESLKDKTILLMNEQGIGDEILFANMYERLIQEAGKIIITCDYRLEKLYKRSFPEAEVYITRDTRKMGYLIRVYKELEEEIQAGTKHVDYAIRIGSLGQHFWEKTTDIPSLREPFFLPDPDIIDVWKSRVEKTGSGLKVGISWASGKADERVHGSYLDIDAIAPILQLPGIEFFNLQYANYEEPIKYAKEKYGATIHMWDDFDVKQDIEANVALMSNLDLVLGPASAPQFFAVAAGVPVWWIMAAPPWWQYGTGDDTVPFYKKGTVITKESMYDDWSKPVNVAKKMIENMIKTKEESI